MKDSLAALLMSEWALGSAGSHAAGRREARWCLVPDCGMRLADGNGDVICRRHLLLEFTDRVSQMTSEQVPDPRGRWPMPRVNAAARSGSKGCGGE